MKILTKAAHVNRKSLTPEIIKELEVEKGIMIFFSWVGKKYYRTHCG